jgi:enediyne biosynthesis protein E4
MALTPGLPRVTLAALLAAAPASAPRGPIGFEDVAGQAGVDFIHENSPTPRKHLIETMPGGVAVFDFDGDSRLDLFFTNGASIPSLEKGPQHGNRLFRNEGGLRFKDVTDAAGLRGAGYSMAAAVADYDNDGDPDLFVGGVHRQALYRNTGGRFEDVAVRAGVGSSSWVVGGAWLDYDNDGWLDLLAVNYTTWSADSDRFCGDSSRNIRVYCHPKWFPPVPLTLHRNRGDGTFEDASERSGIARHKGRGMGVAVADYDQDGFPDVYVANDKLASFLFRNQKDGTLADTGLLAGVSLPEHGQEISAMGADFRDYDNDGRPDIHVTALAGESFPLYRNAGRGIFEDVTHRALLSPLVVSRSGWSTGLFDFDNDGWKDLFTANSHVNDAIDQFEKAAYKETNSVFQSLGNGTFSDATSSAGLDKGPRRAHRGAGFADLDQDGGVDVVVTSLGEPVELWANRSPARGHWLDVRLVGGKSNRDGIGAVVKLTNTRDPRWREQWNHMTTAVGYASSTCAPVHFGTGAAAVIDAVEIRWPSGTVQVLKDVAADQILTVREP